MPKRTKQYKPRTKNPKVVTKYEDTKVLHDEALRHKREAEKPRPIPPMKEIFQMRKK